MDWLRFRTNVADFFHGMAFGGHEKYLRGRAADLNDLFMLMAYMEMVGLPNPAAFYLLDVYPYLVEEFHLWHRRMGFDRSPLATFSCC
jgi:hypothetical protein